MSHFVLLNLQIASSGLMGWVNQQRHPFADDKAAFLKAGHFLGIVAH